MKGVVVERVFPDLHPARASSQGLVGSSLIGEVPRLSRCYSNQHLIRVAFLHIPACIPLELLLNVLAHFTFLFSTWDDLNRKG